MANRQCKNPNCKNPSRSSHEYLCEEHYQTKKARRIVTASLPKCACGNIIGVRNLKQGKCITCIERDDSWIFKEDKNMLMCKCGNVLEMHNQKLGKCQICVDKILGTNNNFNRMVKAVIKNDTLRDLDSAKQSLEKCINATETGLSRNRLCDANIHIMAAKNILENL